MLMDLISMDFIRLFEVTSKGNQYLLRVICMLPSYIMCISLVDKSADTIMSTYLKRYTAVWR